MARVTKNNPYGLSPKLARQVREGEALYRDLGPEPIVQQRRFSPPPAQRTTPVGVMSNPSGEQTGYAVMPNGQTGFYPVISGQGSTLITLPPRYDLFSSMQDRLARFYTMFAPMFAQMAQQARANAGKAARGIGSGRRGGAIPPANGNPYIPTENVQHSQIPAGGLPALGSYADAARRRGYVRPDLWQSPTASDDYEWYLRNLKKNPLAAGNLPAGNPPASTPGSSPASTPGSSPAGTPPVDTSPAGSSSGSPAGSSSGSPAGSSSGSPAGKSARELGGGLAYSLPIELIAPGLFTNLYPYIG